MAKVDSISFLKAVSGCWESLGKMGRKVKVGSWDFFLFNTHLWLELTEIFSSKPFSVVENVWEEDRNVKVGSFDHGIICWFNIDLCLKLIVLVSLINAVFCCWECLGKKVGKSKLGPLIMGFFVGLSPVNG